MFPLDQIAHVGVNLSENRKPLRGEIISEVTNIPTSVPERYSRADRQTDRRTYRGISALCVASRSKNGAIYDHKIFGRTCALLLLREIHPEIRKCSPQATTFNEWGRKKLRFSAFKWQYLQEVAR